jgi:small subunit ribosomal protein S4
MGEKICAHAKCAALRKPYPPGIHGRSKRKGRREASEFGRQLREKQKMRFLYGLSERQFARMVAQAMKKPGEDPGALLARILEMRLDNVVFRLGLAQTPQMARQLISHGHVTVDGKKVRTPSYQTHGNQIVSSGKKEGNTQAILETPESALRLYDKRVIIEYYAR